MNRRDIAERIGRQELLEIARSLIRTPSLNPPGDVRECADLIAGMLEKEEIPVRKIAVTDKLVNVVATLEGKGHGKTLLFNGHMDVVPAGSDWTRDPFGGEFVDGKIYGRGASDMKGGLASMIGSLIALQRAGCPFSGKILFTAVADEETGSDAGTVYLLGEKLIQADYAIVSEPTSGWVEIGNRGIVWLEATLKGKACHAGRPHVGISAIRHAARAIDALERMEFPVRQDIFEVPTGSLTVTTIAGGTKLNVVPDRCTFGMDRRMLPVEDVNDVVDAIRETIAGTLPEGVTFDLRVVKVWPPVLMERDHVLVRAVMNALEEATGQEPQVRAKSASTDASFINGLAGIPIVLYGPGPSRLSHCADEYVELEEVVKASHVYTVAALELLR